MKNVYSYPQLVNKINDGHLPLLGSIVSQTPYTLTQLGFELWINLN